MAEKNLSLRDQLLAAAVVFGGAGNVQDVDIRLQAYSRLLKLAEQIDDGFIEEFDVINALEDLPGFLPRQELRKLANDLKLLERQDDGLLRLKAKIHLDDYRPGEFPFSAPASVPVDFILEAKPKSIGFGTGNVNGALENTAGALLLILKTAKAENLTFVTAFFRMEASEDRAISYNGTRSATTPFLDAYTLAHEFRTRLPDLASDSTKQFLNLAEPWIDTYLKHILIEDDYGDAGAMCLKDDDDYPGADRPAVFSNASLISVLILESNWRQKEKLPQRSELCAVLGGLTRFVLLNQNPDGGWPVYRYRAAQFQGKPTIAPSIPFFSFVTLAGLLDAYFDGERSLQTEIREAMRRYGELLINSAQVLLDDSVGWSNDFSPNSPVDAADTASNLQACLLLPLVLKDQAETFRALARAAVAYLSRHWRPSSALAGNRHRVVFRPPTSEGSAGTPMVWEHAGHAKILRALAQAYCQGIDPGFDGAQIMANTAALIAQECRQGFWLDVNQDNIERNIINVNTGNMSASALLAYEAALAKSRSLS